MKSKILSVAAATLIAAWTAPVSATEFCDLSEGDTEALLERSIVGTWKVESTAGKATINGRSMFIPPRHLSDAKIDAEGIGWRITSTDMGGEFPVTRYVGENWRYELAKDSPLEDSDIMTIEEISTVIGCDVQTVPRLHASGSYPEQGGQVDFDLFLFVISDELMQGVTVGRLSGPATGVALRQLVFTK